MMMMMMKQFGLIACFVGMSWRAEPGDSHMTASFMLKERWRRGLSLTTPAPRSDSDFTDSHV